MQGSSLFEDLITHHILCCVHWSEWQNVIVLNTKWYSIFMSEHFASSYVTNIFRLTENEKARLESTLLLLYSTSLEKYHGKKRKLESQLVLSKNGEVDSFWKVLRLFITLSNKSQYVTDTTNLLFRYQETPTIPILNRIIRQTNIEKCHLSLVQGFKTFFEKDIYLTDEVMITESVVSKILRGPIKQVFVINVLVEEECEQVDYVVFLRYGYPLTVSFSLTLSDHPFNRSYSEQCTINGQYLFVNSFRHDAFSSNYSKDLLSHLKQLIFQNSHKELTAEECDGLTQGSCFRSILYRFLVCGFPSSQFERLKKLHDGEDVLVEGIECVG